MSSNSLPDQLIRENLIHASIVQRLFEKNKNGDFLEKYSMELNYPHIAEALVKIASSLIQAFIIDELINSQRILDESYENVKLKSLMLKLWKLQQLYQLDDSIKFVEYIAESKYCNFVDVSFLTVIKKWKEIFAIFNKDYKGHKINLSEKYDLESLIFELILSLKVLSFTTINNNTIKYNVNGELPMVKLYPYFQFKIQKNNKQSLIMLPIKTQIDKDMFSLKVWYQSPFINDEKGIEEIYRFNHRDEKSIHTRKILKVMGVQLPNHVVQVSGSFEYLQKIIDTTVNVFANYFGVDERSGNKKAIDHAFKSFVNKMKFGNSFSDQVSDVEYSGDLRDVSNYMWVIIIEIGVYNFVKRAIQFFCGNNFIVIAYEVNHLQECHKTYNLRVENELKERKAEMRTSFPDDSSYYIERLSFINESIPITVFLKDLGLNTTNLFSDYSDLTSIDDYINFVNNDEGGNTITSSEKIWKFLYCFYSGIYAYCEYLEQKKGAINSFTEIDSDADEIMIAAAKKTYEYLDKDKDTLYTRNLITKMNELFTIMDTKRYSYKYFGRDIMVNGVGIKEFHDFIDKRNVLSHSSKNVKIGSKDDYKDAIDLLLSNLMFLKTGRLSGLQRDSNSEIDLTLCVYPQVVSFRETIIKRNSVSITGYETYNSNIKNDDKEKANKLILTSQKINQFKEYYCIPHALRSTDEFMIEPFLIACEDFDRLVPIHSVK